MALDGSDSMETPASVLIVDDHEVVRVGLRSLIEPHPRFTVVGEAGSVQEAIKIVHQMPVDIVIMDLRLPDATGIEAIRQLRKINPSLKFVVLTSYINEAFLNQAQKLGVSAYLLKEAHIQVLLDTLEKVAQGETLLTPEHVRRLAHQYLYKTDPKDSPFAGLTQRELQIVALVAQGRTNREIAQELYLSEGTVRNYISEIIAKLRLRNRVELAAYALKYHIEDWVARDQRG